MPVLDITDGNGRLKPRAEETVMAVMAYPSDDPEEVEQRTLLQCLWLYCDHLARESDENSEPVRLGIEDLGRLLFLNPEKVHHDYKRQCGMGRVAGCILTLIELPARIEPGKASVNRAVATFRSVSNQKKKHGEMLLAAWRDIGLPVELFRGRKLPWEGQSRRPMMSTSEAKIREYWGNFKSVSHFWAALMYSKTRFAFGATDGEPYEFLDLLADAEHFRRFGEGHFARGQEKHNNSTLDPDSTWKVPNDLALPESEYAISTPGLLGSMSKDELIEGLVTRTYSKWQLEY